MLANRKELNHYNYESNICHGQYSWKNKISGKEQFGDI